MNSPDRIPVVRANKRLLNATLQQDSDFGIHLVQDADKESHTKRRRINQNDDDSLDRASSGVGAKQAQREEQEVTVRGHCGPPNDTTRAAEKYKIILQRKDAEVQSIREAWHEEVQEILGREERLKTIMEKDRAENVHSKLAQGGRKKADKDLLEELLFRRDDYIFDLERKVKKLARLSTFSTPDSPYPFHLSNNILSCTLDAIGSELDLILSGQDRIFTLQAPSIIESTDLKSLMSSIQGSEADLDQSVTDLTRWTRKFDPEIVIRTLALAAFKAWVLDTSFPNFVVGNAPLLDAYRHAIIDHGELHQRLRI